MQDSSPLTSQRSPGTDPLRPTIAAVLVSCNEADVIEPCLQSVAEWVDEIVVMDMHSRDGTQEVAHKYNARIFEHDVAPFADPVRDEAFALARCDWILMLDPDERVPETLGQELQRLSLRTDLDVVIVPRQQIMFGKVVRSPGATDGSHPRLFRKGILSWPGEVHGKPNLDGLRCYELPTERQEFWLLHDTWRSTQMVLDKIARYAPKDVEKLQLQGQHFTFTGLLRATMGQFIHRMIRGRAYEDGMAGFLTAMYFTIYAFTIQAVWWEAEGRSSRYDGQVLRLGRWLSRISWMASGGGLLLRRKSKRTAVSEH